MAFFLTIAALFAVCGLAEPPAKAVQMEQEVQGVPRGWTVSNGGVPADEPLELIFAVRQNNLQELHDTLLRVSDPASPDYGMHLTRDEVADLVAPDQQRIKVVEDFLRQHGATPRWATPNGDFITATVSVGVAEKLLSADYVTLRHDATGITVRRTLGGYSLPSRVAAAVDFVAPTVHVPGVRRPMFSSPNTTNGLGFNTPKNLRKLYNVGSTEGKATQNKQAVTAFLEQYYSQISLKGFWTMFCRGITCGKGNPKLVGDATTGGAGTESMLDIETITGLAGNVESEFWGYSGRSPENPENEPFLKWLTALSSTSDPDVPKVFSTSYGEDEGSWSLAAATRLNVEFQKAGVRGISLLFASGDEGANCKAGRFTPQTPGSSPYVTAVGGTTATATWPSPGGESAVGLSSGGFSDYWPMPSWQQSAVQKYLQQPGLPASKFGYNISGRAYPDISAQATNFFVIAGLPMPGVAGTSCASPTAAAVFSLLNDLRLQQGKSTLGFLNPLIYAHASAFNDITTGSSSGGCGFSDGWPATPGWDAVTGMGTPDYSKLAQVVSALPAGRLVSQLGLSADLVV